MSRGWFIINYESEMLEGLLVKTRPYCIEDYQHHSTLSDPDKLLSQHCFSQA